MFSIKSQSTLLRHRMDSGTLTSSALLPKSWLALLAWPVRSLALSFTISTAS
ncbi:hypothetical protein Mapa_010408 [Marchantia paleacea]|nr:hypothetical protein Mapa_010408 [Marchantia paleacea]